LAARPPTSVDVCFGLFKKFSPPELVARTPPVPCGWLPAINITHFVQLLNTQKFSKTSNFLITSGFFWGEEGGIENLWQDSSGRDIMRSRKLPFEEAVVYSSEAAHF
jgi:hypothetical protein